MKYIQPAKKAIAVVILLLILWISYNALYNIHYHITNDGRYFFHAHPFARTSSTQSLPIHHHTRVELLIYYQISIVIAFLLFTKCLIFIISIPIRTLFNYSIEFNLKSFIYHIVTRRGPPHTLLFLILLSNIRSELSTSIEDLCN